MLYILPGIDLIMQQEQDCHSLLTTIKDLFGVNPLKDSLLVLAKPESFKVLKFKRKLVEGNTSKPPINEITDYFTQFL